MIEKRRDGGGPGRRHGLRPLGVAAGVCCLLALGCTSFGARTVRRSSFSYNEAIVSSWNEQLLLNLARLRYRDTPYFLRVSSVVTQYTFEGAAAVGGELVGSSGGDSATGDLGVEYSERPTVTYHPVQGEDFATELLYAVSLDTLFLLTGSGWNAELVFRCCVERIAHLRNAPAMGGRPGDPDNHADFLRVGELLQTLRQATGLDVHVADQGGLKLTFAPHAQESSEARELRRLLGLPAEVESFTLVPLFTLGGGEDQVGVLPRSLMSIFFFLTHGVEVPEEDVSRGLVAREEPPDTVASIFHVHSSREVPPDAFTRVRYRGVWFYIRDGDLATKQTFGLLSYLFALQSGDPTKREPLQTLSLGE